MYHGSVDARIGEGGAMASQVGAGGKSFEHSHNLLV
jgi:hypothetical protein